MSVDFGGGRASGDNCGASDDGGGWPVTQAPRVRDPCYPPSPFFSFHARARAKARGALHVLRC